MADGRLDAGRVASYTKLQAELEESTKEPWAKAADRQQKRVFSRALNKRPSPKK